MTSIKCPQCKAKILVQADYNDVVICHKCLAQFPSRFARDLELFEQERERRKAHESMQKM